MQILRTAGQFFAFIIYLQKQLLKNAKKSISENQISNVLVNFA